MAMKLESTLANGLIIDDDKNVHEILTEGLPMFTFSSAYNLNDSTKILQKESFAFILLDYRLGTQKQVFHWFLLYKNINH